MGLHSAIVELGLRWGILLFITSEVFFLREVLLGLLPRKSKAEHRSRVSMTTGGINPFNTFGVPLLNTIVLVSSGVRVTWAHHALIEGDYDQIKRGLISTVALGVYFTMLQGLEYYEASFSFADGVYGSTFFIATGFHGLHVLVGTLFLLVCLLRHFKREFRAAHHFGFEAAAWY